jgi:hypothetical protein
MAAANTIPAGIRLVFYWNRVLVHEDPAYGNAIFIAQSVPQGAKPK